MTVKSTAELHLFCFAQNTYDHRCHISFTRTSGGTVNVQIGMNDAAKLAENLIRVIDADRVSLSNVESEGER